MSSDAVTTLQRREFLQRAMIAGALSLVETSALFASPQGADPASKAGVENNTIFVFTSDHGEMRWSQGLGTKQYPGDESARVPFLLKDPRLNQTAGTKNPAPIDAPDVMPTLLGLCGLPVPSGVQGRDWSPTIRGEEQLSGEEAPAESPGGLFGVAKNWNQALQGTEDWSPHVCQLQRRPLAALRQSQRSVPDEEPDQ